MIADCRFHGLTIADCRLLIADCRIAGLVILQLMNGDCRLAVHGWMTADVRNRQSVNRQSVNRQSPIGNP
jgi:hypothetical protein